jgi:ribonuclease HI
LRLKLKCFMWLSLENKLLNQDNFQKRGGIIVNGYILCGADLEYVGHLLVDCPFTGVVWWKVVSVSNIYDNWGMYGFYNWIKKHKKLSTRDLAGLVSWNIWKLRNSIFFKFAAKHTDVVVGRIVRAYKEIVEDVGKPLKLIKKGHVFHKLFPWCFFDGACQGRYRHCGGGIVINLSYQHVFHFHLGEGTRTNTRAKLLTLWDLLVFEKEKEFQRIQIARDSVVIVKWFQGVYSIEPLALEPWQRNIKALHEAFIDIQMCHIPRSLNSLVDDLSKNCLSLDPRLMMVDEVVDSQVVLSTSHFVF